MLEKKPRITLSDEPNSSVNIAHGKKPEIKEFNVDISGWEVAAWVLFAGTMVSALIVEVVFWL